MASEAKALRTFRAPERLTACSVVGSKIATGTQEGALLMWNLAPGRPRPVRLVGHTAQVTCIRASTSLMVSASTDATVAIWGKGEKPAKVKLHFSPVRCVDISSDERLLLTASDDKSVKLCRLPERQFAASYLGHSNWVRTASFSSSASHIVSGGDDKTVRLWDVERKLCLQSFHDAGAAVTCAKFGFGGGGSGDQVLVASSWDSSLNLWDVRSYGLRQHYGRAHGTSPIMQLAVHPKEELLLSCAADRQLRVWDLRAGKLRETVLGHDRPVHSCCWDELGAHFVSCDSELAFYWSSPVDTDVPCPSEAATARPARGYPQREMSKEQTEREGLGAAKTAEVPEVPELTSVTEPQGCSLSGFRETAAAEPLSNFLEAAWAGAKAHPSKPSKPPGPATGPTEEAVARLMEKMVTDMEALTQQLGSLELRLNRTEQSTQHLAELMAGGA
ncbi:unnamed protein product [Effrenium voratum]|uniref:Uncharacterized protein n=1 Tax=Effrenium voratum TaxID=2562239 RepID=A0AA36JLA0_9DINO|nr:unnamed protein product [Effrenium voratum]